MNRCHYVLLYSTELICIAECARILYIYSNEGEKEEKMSNAFEQVDQSFKYTKFNNGFPQMTSKHDISQYHQTNVINGAPDSE